MVHQASQAIVLQTRDYSELDRIVSLYTKDFGRLQGIAKAAKRSQRRFGGTLEPATCVNAFFVVREGLVRLERCELVEAFPQLALDVKKTVFSSYLVELVQLLTPERQSSPDIFELLYYFIRLLAGSAFREGMLRLFELRLFSLLGYQPQFLHCTVCNNAFRMQESYTFSVRRGGLVCGRCAREGSAVLPLSKGTIRAFQQAQQLELSKISRLCLSREANEEGKIIFGRFLEYHIGRKPKSLSILNQL